MECNEKRLIIVLLSMATTILIAGCFAGYFIVYVWTNTVRITSANYATDAYVAVTLLVYFTMMALFGAAIGLIINGCINKMMDAVHKATKRIAKHSDL